MKEDLQELQRMINKFSKSEFELKQKVRDHLIEVGFSSRMADIVIVNGSVQNFSWVLNAVIGQIVGDREPTKETDIREKKIFEDLNIAVRDILAKHTGKTVAFINMPLGKESDEQ